MVRAVALDGEEDMRVARIEALLYCEACLDLWKKHIQVAYSTPFRKTYTMREEIMAHRLNLQQPKATQNCEKIRPILRIVEDNIVLQCAGISMENREEREC